MANPPQHSEYPKSSTGIARLRANGQPTNIVCMDAITFTFSAGILAGAMNTLAGGGFLATLPALIAAGLPPVQANTARAVALFPRQLPASRRHISSKPLAPSEDAMLDALLETIGTLGFLLSLVTKFRKQSGTSTTDNTHQ